MKKVLLSLLLIIGLVSVIPFYSCDKEAEEKCCWYFTVKQVTSISPFTSGYPKTSYSTVKQCDLTESEAETVISKMTNVATSSSGKYNITVSTTVTKSKTETTGIRVPTGY